MSKDTYKTADLEILIATMYRTSLYFLDAIFAKSGLNDFKILIINQTDENSILESTHLNIRVINSFEKGLSKSRNLAIRNAKGSICLNVDDDVVFMKGFSEIIVSAFNNIDFPIITFETLTTEGKPYWKYPKEAMPHNNYVSQKTLSIEIAFKVAVIIKNNLFFDERFGLGAQFEDAENYVFLNDAKKGGLMPYFCPK
ncbi:MAG: glycosyltransferase family 2 protein, partial [Flavobacteriales bacterium]|nr:glycosyltransferase family 2 protein [Flavobacteriales bacterium]